MSVAVHDYSMVVGGAWAESESGRRTEATSPGTGASLGTVPEGTRTDATRASDRGRQPSLARVGREDRVRAGPRRWTGAAGFPTDLYWQATVLTGVTEDMEVAREETFGLVVPVTRISSDEEALQIANASPYGLLTAVWTRDLARGLRFAEAVDAGWANINESTNYWESHLPFRGRAGSSSGVGRVGGSSVLEAFTESKTVVVRFG